MSILIMFLCILTYTHTSLAGPQPVHSTVVILSDFISHLPKCAAHCINDFISTSFPTCQSYGEYQDLACLCPSQSRSQLTLGEGSLRCLVSSCTAATLKDLDVAYWICSDVPNAQTPTHSILSAPLIVPTNTLDQSSSGRTSPTRHVETSATRKSLKTSVTSRSSQASSTTSSPTATSKIARHSTAHGSATSTSSESSAKPAKPLTTSSRPAAASITTAAVAAETFKPSVPVLNKAQIAGIAVAGSVVCLIATSLLCFLFCCRNRRNKRRESDASFGMTGQYASVIDGWAPAFTGSRSAPAPSERSGNAQQFVGVPGGPSQKRWTAWRNAMSRTPPAPQIGLAVSPDGNRAVTQDSSPLSSKSYHTTSQLLPDKPVLTSSTLQVPMSSTRHPLSNDTPANTFPAAQGPGIRLVAPTPPPKIERRKWDEDNTGQSVLQSVLPRPQPQLRTQLSDPFIDKSGDPGLMMYTTERQRASTKDLPRIIPPNNGYEGSASYPVSRHHEPPPHLASLIPAPLNPASYASSCPSIAPQPRTLSSGNAAWQVSDITTNRALSSPRSSTALAVHIGTQSDRSQLPSQTQYQFNKYLPIKSSRRASLKRPETYYTTGSETSFEDDLGESPPEPPSKSIQPLSPVAESPTSHATPLSRVRYPQVPSSSAERGAVKSPKTHLNGSRPSDRTTLSPAQLGSPGGIRIVARPAPVLSPQSRPFRGPVELPEESVSRDSPLYITPRSRESMHGDKKKGAKFQILCSSGLDGNMEVSGSPTMVGAGLPTKKPSPKTPPEWKAGRHMHAVSRGQWID
jgi:hypothetical protein